MDQITFFSRKKYVCLPYLKHSDPLPETHTYLLFGLSVYCVCARCKLKVRTLKPSGPSNYNSLDESISNFRAVCIRHLSANFVESYFLTGLNCFFVFFV